MIRKNQTKVSLRLKRTRKYLHYVVQGSEVRPLRFELIDLDGKKAATCDVIHGNEFVVPLHGIGSGEYLIALSNGDTLLHTGVLSL